MGKNLTPRALQHEDEVIEFLKLLKSEKVKSFLEIGSKFGYFLKRVAGSLPRLGGRLVAVDMPFGDQSNLVHLRKSVSDLVLNGYDARLILGDSTDQEVIDEAKALGPYDCVFIDANHTLPYVTKDWENYGPMAKMVCFHDIAWKRGPEWKGAYTIDVPEFWNKIKRSYAHPEFRNIVEIKRDPTGQDNGIGVLWR